MTAPSNTLRTDLSVWLQERAANAERIANTKRGEDRAGWEEDASYFREALHRLSDGMRRIAELEAVIQRYEDEATK